MGELQSSQLPCHQWKTLYHQLTVQTQAVSSGFELHIIIADNYLQRECTGNKQEDMAL